MSFDELCDKPFPPYPTRCASEAHQQTKVEIFRFPAFQESHQPRTGGSLVLLLVI